MSTFYGRKREIQLLEDFCRRDTAGLIILKGRRRIGKSSLIEHLGKNKLFKHFFEIQGLAPKIDDEKPIQGGKQALKLQLENFAEQLSQEFHIEKFPLENWTQAFQLLDRLLPVAGKTLLFLDEISWMARGSNDFAGKLKIAWDKNFNKKNNLILVLCGSVSSWMEDNILKHAGFMGRSSLKFTLEELPLHECNLFWHEKAQRISPMEKLRIVSITGGIPRYLEEVNFKKSAEYNIKQMSFTKAGILFNEFDDIFNNIFGRRSENYKHIVLELVDRKKTFQEISQKLKGINSGTISEYLNDLTHSGFIARDYTYTFKGRRSEISKFRIRDNYLRFYLKYIYPKKDLIEKNLYELKSLDTLENYDIIMGYQFENLVLNNISKIIEKLGLTSSNIKSASPYFQNKTKRLKACQIDLLISTKYSIYVCEIKFRNTVSLSIINEVKNKIESLRVSKNISVRPVLIYAGALDHSIQTEGFFDEIINFEDLLYIDG